MTRTATLATLFFLVLSASYAETDHADAVFSATTKGGTRLQAEGKLSDRVVSFLSTFFAIPSETIRKNYNTAMPDAIEKVIQNKDESAIGEMLAKLFGQINVKQTQDLMNAADKEITAENDSGEKKDERYIALMERLKWGGMIRIDKTPEKPEAKAFVEAFQKAFEKVKEWNEEANKKLQLASDGNIDAKKWVRKELGGSLLRFAEGQHKSGNESAAVRAIKAASQSEGKQLVLDMFAKGPEAQRLFLGDNGNQTQEALTGFLESKKTFADNFLPSEKHGTTPEKSWYINDQKAFTKGAPTGFTPAVAKQQQTPTQTPTTTSGANGAATLAEFKSVISGSNCTSSCHMQIEFRGNSPSDPDFGIKALPKGTEFRSLSYLADLLNGHGMMGSQVSDSDKQKILKFLK